MKQQKLFEFRNIIKALPAAFLIFLSVRYAAECTEGIKKGILFCLEILVPSLFLLMAISAYLVRSGLTQTITKRFKGAARFLFHLPPQSLSVILLSMLGGYPIGAGCAAMLAEQGQLSDSEAEKTACIAVCAGPGFLLNFVGSALLSSRQAGIILLIAELAGLLITGIIIGRWLPCEPPLRRPNRGAIQKNLLIRCVNDAARSAYHMCGMVLIGAACVEVIASVSPDDRLTDILSATIEITTGCQRMCGKYPLYLIAFFIGFGGISVHWQIFAGMGELKLRKGLFFVFRIMQGMIAAVSAYLLLMVFPVQQSVFNSVNEPITLAAYATPVGSAALILLSLCFTGSIHQRKKAFSDSQ